MPWHITPRENVEGILSEGLKPAIGPRSADLGEVVEAVHLFSTLDDLMDANWVEDAFDEDVELALFQVAVPRQIGAWTEVAHPIPPDLIVLHAMDMETALDSQAMSVLRALDAPFSDTPEI